MPQFAWKFNFGPFFPIFACSLATPWPHLRFGLSHDIFVFFPNIIWWLKALILNKKSELFLFTSHFSTIFANFFNMWLLAHLAHFAHPMGNPYHQWPQFQLLCSLYFISPWETFPMDFINDFQTIYWKWQFFYFWPFWSLRTPHMGCVWLWVKSLIWSWN